MAISALQIKQITAPGTTIIPFTTNSSGVFSIAIPNNTRFTFKTAIDANGDIVEDLLYRNFKRSVQDTFINLSKFVIEIHEMPAGSIVRFEYKVIS